MFSRKQNSELDTFSELLQKGIIGLFKERGDIEFSKPPEVQRRKIIEYNGRMRADGMEKFDNEATFVSVVNFYASAKDLEKKKTLGALVVYVQQEYLSKLMKMLRYPTIDDENEQALLDSVGTLCNIVSGRFKSEILQAGYIDLEMSHFTNFRNSAFDGVAFCYSEYDIVQADFQINNERRLVIEMTMGVVPKR